MRSIMIGLGLLLSQGLYSQSVKGSILDEEGIPLVGANVYSLNTESGTTTDSIGQFELPISNTIFNELVISFVGYISDTLKVSDGEQIAIHLKRAQFLEEVVIRDRKEGTIISNLNTIKTEKITSAELRKAACCDLAGCFETQTSVDPQVTNVVTNAKELRIAGLSGVYNQVLIDGLPMIQGLTYTYGISSVPGTSVENIYVAKGANSVLQGYESISGQINVITKDPDIKEPLFLNAYINSFGEKQLNLNSSFKVGIWKNMLSLHTVQPAGKKDWDEDNFLDVPLLRRYLISDKWKYGNENEWGWSSEISLRYLNEERTGGQVPFDAKTDKGSNEVYGQNVQLSQPEFLSKTNFRFNDNHNISVDISSFYQNQNSWFGTVRYDARQTNLYTNAQYEWYYSEENILKTGVSYRHLNLDEDIAFSDNVLNRTYAGQYERSENIPGFFAENSSKLLGGKLTWLAGVRGDSHNQFGFKFTSRTLLKYNFNDYTVIRANAGTGWRTVNLFSENINLLVSSRDIQFVENLEPERATNLGLNLTHRIEKPNATGYISADFYHTTFQNQIFPDYDLDPTKAIIQNFRGTSISNSLQLESGMRLFKILDLKLGYNYLDVYRMENDSKQQLPFNAKHKVITVFGYRPLSSNFQIDLNAHWYGKQRLPSTHSNPEDFQRPDFSDSFSLVNAQFTYHLNTVEIYVGCENLFDFRQERPILGWENPFGQYFDTSFVWGPTRGREFYAGVRYRMAKE